MSSNPGSTRRALRVVGRALAGAGLALVFAFGSGLGLVLYANLPAGRRVVAVALERALARTFEGRFAIEGVDRVSLTELQAHGVTVHDPDGHLVLSVSALSAEADLVALARKLLFDTGTVTLRIGHARLERAEVYLLPGQTSNVPTIVEAFTPTPSAPPASAPSAASRTFEVWLPEIEVGHLYGRMALDGVPTLETELSSVRGSVIGTSKLTSVDVERFSALVRGLGGTDARGVGSVHVRAPGAVWTSFDGYFGDLQLGTVVRVDGPRLDITLDVPRAEPAAARALWGAYPLHKDVGAHVEGVGTLQSMHTQAKFSIEQGTIASSGELRLSEHPGLDLDLSGRNLDLQAVWPSAPRTAVDADSKLSVFQSGNDWLADVSGTTRATRIADTPIPPIDLAGNYSSKGFVGHATLHEPGVPLSATFEVHPDGSVDGTAQAKRVDLSRAPRLTPYFAGRGLLDLELKGRIDKSHWVVSGGGQLQAFESGRFSAKSSKWSGRATGPVATPERASLDLAITSQGLRAGAFSFDQVETKVKGPVRRPVVSATLTNQRGPAITVQATVTADKNPRLDDLSLELRSDRAVLAAKVARIALDGDNVQVSGVELSGAGGTLTGSGSLGPDRVALTTHGATLDLKVIGQALGLPRGLLEGKLALDADFESTAKTGRGGFQATLEKGATEGVEIESLSLTGELHGSELNLKTSAKLPHFGSFTGEARASLPGSLANARTLEHATGIVTVKAEHVPFGLLGYALPKAWGVSEVRGEGSATLVLDRSDPNAIPNASLVANTSGLYVGLIPREKATAGAAFDGTEAHAGLNVNGTTGETDLTLKLEDSHGALLSATTRLSVDLARALRHPEQLLDQLRATPLVAKAVVEDRPLEELPGPLAPRGLAGRLRSEMSVHGTLDNPTISDKTELYHLRLGRSDRDKAIDVCGQVDYDKRTGQYGARGEVFLPGATERACLGRRVAQFSAGGLTDFAKLQNPSLNAEPAWTGTAGLSLEGLPLDILPTLAEAGVAGRVYGVVMLDRRDALPQIRSQLEIRDAIVARTRLGTAGIQAQTDGRSLTAALKIEQPASGPTGSAPGGTLQANIQSSVDWQGVVPGIDETRPISAQLTAHDVDAIILTPFVHDVLSEIGGKLDAKLEVSLTPELAPEAPEPWTGAVKGTLAMHDGTLQLAQLALRMHAVKFAARAEPHQNSTLIVIESMTAAAEADETNLAARGNLWLTGFRAEKGNANVTVQALPFLVEGVTLATLSGKDIGVELERHPKEMFVGLTVPSLEAKLPQAASRELISLGNNQSIEVAQPIAEPYNGSNGAALPWRMKFDLGSKVKVTRADLYLPLSGSPELELGEQLGITGNLDLGAGGRVSLPGLPRPFTIESGRVFFDSGADPKNPRIQVTAVCLLSQLTVRAHVSGTFLEAKITFESDDPNLTSQAQIEAALLSAPTESTSPATAGLGAGAGYLGKQLLANTALSNLEIKAGNETTADQRSYATYSAAYPLTDELWFEGSYKTLQTPDLTGANSNAFSGTFDWRFRRNWSLRTEVGNIGAGVDLLWQYRY